jgi:hypothetical protein
MLASLKILPGNRFVETTGSSLAHGGIEEVQKHLKQLERSGGGCFLVDEAYQLTEGHGRSVIDFLLTEIDKQMGKVVFIFAGYADPMKIFLCYNPGFQSRISCTLRLEDYADASLLSILQHHMNNFCTSAVTVEDGFDRLCLRIAIRRLGRGRGNAFGNTRAVGNLFRKIRERQADRLTKEQRSGLSPLDYRFTREDIIGLNPSQALLNCPAWDELQKLTGLTAVKDSIKSMLTLAETNHRRDLRELEPLELTLNRVFLGPAGTGKTTVAKLYGQILVALGMLSDGEGMLQFQFYLMYF